MPGLEDFPNHILRAMPDVIIVYRSHVPWGQPYLVDEPVDICKQTMIRFTLPRLRMDALDLQNATFTYRFIQAVTDEDLAVLRARLTFEEEIHFALRYTEKSFYTHE